MTKAPKTAEVGYDCCYRCWYERTSGAWLRRMFLCPTCGNKRCPKASDHQFACTHSNKAGQPGSIYA